MAWVNRVAFKLHWRDMPTSRNYTTGLNERLRDPDYVAEYLNAAAKESQDVFMLALRDVAARATLPTLCTSAMGRELRGGRDPLRLRSGQALVGRHTIFSPGRLLVGTRWEDNSFLGHQKSKAQQAGVPAPHWPAPTNVNGQMPSLPAASPPTLRLRSGPAFSQRTRKVEHPFSCRCRRVYGM